MCSAKQRTSGKVSIGLYFFLAASVCDLSFCFVTIAVLLEELALVVVFVEDNVSPDTKAA